jgi:uncharacterized membrane protein
MFYPFIELLFFITRKEFFNKAVFLFLFIGVIGAFIAVLSGNQAFEIVNDWSVKSKEVFNLHQNYANISVWYFTILLTIRYFLFIKKKLTRTLIAVFILLAFIGSYFVFQTGYYGGKVAHRNRVNTTVNPESIK